MCIISQDSAGISSVSKKLYLLFVLLYAARLVPLDSQLSIKIKYKDYLLAYRSYSNIFITIPLGMCLFRPAFGNAESKYDKIFVVCFLLVTRIVSI